MPSYLVFELPPDSIKAANATDPLTAFIPLPIAVEPKTPVAIFVEAGKELPPMQGQVVKWEIPEKLKLTDVCSEGLTVLAGEYPVVVSAKKGMLVAGEKKLRVSGLYEISGDVSNRTGNIETPASVLIMGNVSHGVTIVSGGDVEVRGLVEEASIRAAGSIVAKGGFTGGAAGKLSAGKDMFCQFVQGGTVEAAGNIVVDGSAMNANIFCGKKLVIRGSGFLVGGKAIVREGVDAARVGSEAAVSTEIEMGGNPFQTLQIETLNDAVRALEKSIETQLASIKYHEKGLNHIVRHDEADPVSSLFRAADMLRREWDSFTDERKEDVSRFGAGIMNLMELNRTLEEERQKLAAVAEGKVFFDKAKLVVMKIIHPGAVVKIADAVLRLDREYERASFYYKKGQGDTPSEVAVGFV